MLTGLMVAVALAADPHVARDRQTPPPVTNSPAVTTPPPIHIVPAPLSDALSTAPLYRTIGPWRIRVDNTAQGDGCFLTRVVAGRVIFRAGWLRGTDAYHLYVGDPAWRSIVAGRSYRIGLAFDDQPAWEGDAIGIPTESADGWALLYMRVDKPRFLEDIAQRQALSIRLNGREIERLWFDLGREAIDAMQTCQQSFREGRDPFAASARDRPADAPSTP